MVFLSKTYQPRKAGFIPASFAGRKLAPEKNGRVELISLERELPVRSDEVVAKLPMSGIHTLLAQKGAAVIVNAEQIPDAILSPFTLAGREFEQDFHAYLSALVFFESIKGKMNEWSSGFELSMLNLEQKDFWQLLGSTTTEISYDNGRGVIFVNTTAPDEGLIPAEELHWSLSWFIGRLRAGNLALGEHGRDCVAAIYQTNMLRGFISGNLHSSGLYYDSQLTQDLKCLAGINQHIADKAYFLSDQEKETIARHENGSLENIISFNRAVVERYLQALQEL